MHPSYTPIKPTMSGGNQPSNDLASYINRTAAELRTSLLSKTEAKSTYTPLTSTSTVASDVATNAADILAMEYADASVSSQIATVAPRGLPPVTIVATTMFVLVSITETVPPPLLFGTYTRVPAGLTATP